MSEQVLAPTPAEAPASADDLVSALQKVLQSSPEPLTVPKIRSLLPAALRALNVEDSLLRQVAANVLYQYPKYRSQHDRFWDRPMPVHVAWLLKEALAERPLNLAELRRKLPVYAKAHIERVLEEQVLQKQLFRHPNTGRGGERFGLRPADPKDYLPAELAVVFSKLEQLGFTAAQIRAGALELLHNEEWAPEPVPARTRKQPEQSAAATPAEPDPAEQPEASAGSS
jgi:hypothetical protein